MVLFSLLLSLSACASTKPLPSFVAGDEKNSLPFLDNNLIGEVHSITVPPFYGDHDGWTESALELLASSARIHVIPLEKTGSVINEGEGNASSGLEDRLDLLAGLGKSAGSDAVLNGIVLESKEKHEIILQLIVSDDSRVIWWQAREFAFTGSAPSPSDLRKMLVEMLDPLLSRLARKEKPAASHVTESRSGSDEQSEGDGETKIEPLKNNNTESESSTKPKKDKKTRKNAQPGPVPEDINPM